MLCRQQTLYTSHVFSIIQFFFYYQAFQSSSSLIHIPLVASLFDSWDPCLSLHHFPPYLQEVSSVLVHPPNGLSLRLGYTRIPNLFPLYIRTSKLLFKMGLHSSTPAYYRYTFFRFCIPAIRNVWRISSSFSPFSPSLCSHLSLRSPRSLFLSFPFLSSALNNYSALLPVLSLPLPGFTPHRPRSTPWRGSRRLLTNVASNGAGANSQFFFAREYVMVYSTPPDPRLMYTERFVHVPSAAQESW